MQTETTSRTMTLTAMYRDRDAAERAASALEAAGIPGNTIELHSKATGAARPKEQALPTAPNRFVAGVFGFLMPEIDQRHFGTGMEKGHLVVVVKGVPAGSEAEVVRILDQEAIQVEDEPETPQDQDGPIRDTVGQFGGAGSATGEHDRLTGQRVGTPEGLHTDEPEDPTGGSPGQATGTHDRLTGKRIGGEAPGEAPEARSGTRPRRVRLYPDR